MYKEFQSQIHHCNYGKKPGVSQVFRNCASEESIKESKSPTSVAMVTLTLPFNSTGKIGIKSLSIIFVTTYIKRNASKEEVKETSK